MEEYLGACGGELSGRAPRIVGVGRIQPSFQPCVADEIDVNQISRDRWLGIAASYFGGVFDIQLVAVNIFYTIATNGK